MNTAIVISLIVLLVGFLTLGFISPYNNDNKDIFQIQEPQIIEKEVIREIEKIVEVPVEKVVEVPIEKEIPSVVWRNIGLELFQESNLDRFTDKLNFLKGKKVTIVTDSSYVLGANFKDHKIYRGILTNFEFLEGRYPDLPIVQFTVNVPVLSTTTVNLSWVYDKYRFDSDFSSSELVANFLKTGEPTSELFLVEA